MTFNSSIAPEPVGPVQLRLNMTGNGSRLEEYISGGLALFLSVIGGMVNSYTFVELARRMYDLKRHHKVSPKFVILKMHLSLSDLLLVLLYLPNYSIWLLTFQWLGGDLLCRFFRFIDAFTFYLSSNLIAVIAIDRCASAKRTSFASPNVTLKLKVMLGSAWLLAVGCAAPQVFLWQLTAVATPGSQILQCANVFTIKRFRDHQRLTRLSEEIAYQLFHLLTVFWVPGFIIFYCYVAMYSRLFSTSICTRQRENLLPTSALVTSNSWASHYAEGQTLTAVHAHNGVEDPDERRHSHQDATNDQISSLSTPVKTGSHGLSHFSRSPSINPAHSHSDNNPVSQETGDTSPMRVRVPSTYSQRPSLTPKKPQPSAQLRRARRLTRRQTFAIISAYLISWLPYNMLSLWNSFRPNDPIMAYISWTKFLIVLNAILHPMLYEIKDKPRQK